MSDARDEKLWDAYWNNLDEEGRAREREMMALHYEETMRRRAIEGET